MTRFSTATRLILVCLHFFLQISLADVGSNGGVATGGCQQLDNVSGHESV